jgi:hypothetical protein
MPGIQNSRSTLNFLGGLGTTDRGDNVKLNNTAKALVILSEFLIKTAQNNLNKGGNIASGATSDSMEARQIQVNGSKMSVEIEILSTYKFLDKGVRGVKSGTGKYSFKTMYANKRMKNAIKKWLLKRSIASKYKAISKTEAKNQEIKRKVTNARNVDKMDAFAYAVAVSIKKKGIKPTMFFSKAVAATERKAKEEFAKAIKLDIVESIGELNKN